MQFRNHLVHSTVSTVFLALAGAAPSAVAQQPIIDCSAVDLVPNTVQMTWPDVPTEDTVAARPPGPIQLILVSSSEEELDHQLIGHMQAGGERKTIQLGTGVLPPFATTVLELDLGEHGIDIDNLAFSGRFSVESRCSSPTTGGLVDRAFSPPVFFHQTTTAADSTLFLYGQEARRTQFNYGDLQYQVHNSSVPEPGLVGIFDGGKGIGNDREGQGPGRPPVGGGVQPASNDLLGGPPRWEFCMRWVYESIDSGFGEDHYQSGTLMKARGMRVEIDHPNWTEPKLFFASDNNGCVAFQAAENTGFEVTVYAEARLGGSDNVTIRSYDTYSQGLSFNEQDIIKWMFVANPGGSPRRVYYQNQPDEHSNLMAFGSFMFHWIDHQTFPRMPGNRILALVTQGCNNDGTGSCQSSHVIRLEPGKTNRKFLVGHEVGHWMHRQWTDDNMGYYNNSWSANSGDPDCAFVGVGSHAMRSKEYSVGAFIEGFAHYLSALAWNDHSQTEGIFKYYKEVATPAYADMAADNWRVSLDGLGLTPLGGISNWMANMCSVHDGHSVEMDWMRFFWDYRTNAGDQPSHYDIFELIGFTRDAHPWGDSLHAYDQTEIAIQDAGLGQLGYVNRFLTLASINGVAQ